MNMSAGKIRVLVVDDSVVMRRLLAEAISSDYECEVAGFAANGQVALSLLDRVAPDVMTLDVEMPVLDGLATLKAMRGRGHAPHVIMVSTLTERGGAATVEALALGASDYVTKPTSSGDYKSARERMEAALLPKIKALCRKQRLRPTQAAHQPHADVCCRKSRFDGAIDIVAIGCSTGGPNALAEVLSHLPSGFPTPVVIVQHMPPAFTRFLAQRLTTLCPLPVREAVENEPLAPGEIWIAPGGHHLTLGRAGKDVRMRITNTPPENSCRPSVDVLFRSVAQVYRGALGVVMTGMGQDGLLGCEALSEAGAAIIAQDEASSVVWGMPGFVARAGLADSVVPLDEIADHIVDRVTRSRSPGLRRAAGA